MFKDTVIKFSLPDDLEKVPIYKVIESFNSKFGLVRTPVKNGENEDSHDNVPPTMSNTKYEMLCQTFMKF